MPRLTWIALTMLLTSSVCSTAFAAAETSSQQHQFKKENIRAIANRVADWQLAQPLELKKPWRIPVGDWVFGPFINGLFAIGQLEGNAKYIDEVRRIGKQQNWKVIRTKHPANDHCVPQTWLELYEIDQNPAMLAATQKALDKYMQKVDAGDDDLTFIKKNYHKWSWCDALYMSPPTYARLAKVTGDDKYLQHMNKWWRLVSNFYFDREHNLYYRDQFEKEKKEANGMPVFWSRGVGWVIGGLVRVLQYVPANDAARPMYEAEFRAICETLKRIQQPNGLWASGLLDPDSYPIPETSGSGFFVYAIAYGINEGLLDRESYYPVLERAWPALCRFVKEDGKFVGVQPIGSAPGKYDPETTFPYGTGAFLLAASEMYRVVEEVHQQTAGK